MKLINVQKNVYCGQCKNTVLRIQIGYVAIYFLVGFIPGWVGTQIGIFSPRKVNGEYRRTGFYLRPWFAPDKPIHKLPTWYLKLTKWFSFGNV